MGALHLKIKHSGKTYDLEVDTASQNGYELKTLVMSLTGVPPDRQKIIVKGGQLKDDADLSKLSLKEVSSVCLAPWNVPVPSAFQCHEQNRLLESTRLGTGMLWETETAATGTDDAYRAKP